MRSLQAQLAEEGHVVSLVKLCRWQADPAHSAAQGLAGMQAAQGFRPRAKSLPSVVSLPGERWATDLMHVWCGKSRRASLAVIIGCCTREVLGWQLSDNGSTKIAEAALEEGWAHRVSTFEPASGATARQRPDSQQSPLYEHGEGVWPDPEVHDAIYAGAERPR